MREILCFFMLNVVLVINLYAQQSSLDSIAIQIQSYVNKNKVNLEGWHELAIDKDSLHIANGLAFIREIDLDKTVFIDSLVYNLIAIKSPFMDSTIVDIYSTGWKLGESVFVTSEVMGDFEGGFKKHSEKLYDYIQGSGIVINDSLDFTVFFDDKHPSKLLHIQCLNESLMNVVASFYKNEGLKKYFPPIRYGVPLFSSYRFNYNNLDSRFCRNEYNDFESLVSSDKYIYSLSIWREEMGIDSILVFDTKKGLPYILADQFLNQFSKEHQSFIKELVETYYHKKWKSELLKVSIVPKE